MSVEADTECFDGTGYRNGRASDIARRNWCPELGCLALMTLICFQRCHTVGLVVSDDSMKVLRLDMCSEVLSSSVFFASIGHIVEIMNLGDK